jgi:ATP-dependent protease HslVU (ClpYQ) peptidase subunit
VTCIVGIEDRKSRKVYIGCDSAGVAGYDLMVRADEKVFQNGDLLIGYTSSFRMGQLLRYSLEVPKHPAKLDSLAYMVKEVVPAIRKCFKDNGYQKTENSVESGGTFLVGYQGELFVIYEDYQVGKSACGVNAVGCGSVAAIGAMLAMPKEPPKSRAMKALKISEQTNAGVRGPFKVMEGK